MINHKNGCYRKVQYHQPTNGNDGDVWELWADVADYEAGEPAYIVPCSDTGFNGAELLEMLQEGLL